jgi:glycosyltransferase involved in cell wall biosynthesis
MPDFESDPYPGKPKILFIGAGGSTHTHAWIDLLSAPTLNVRLFALPEGGIPPAAWMTRTYLPQDTHLLPSGLDPSTRKALQLFPEEAQRRAKQPAFWLYMRAAKALNSLGQMASFPTADYDQPFRMSVTSQQKWLQQIISDWQPDIIHLLGLETSGHFVYQTYRQFPFKKTRWILQLRGGSDLVFSRLIPESLARIQPILQNCDQILTDNKQNIQYLYEMGVRHDQIPSLVPVPGTGGVDVDRLTSIRTIKTTRSREIVFPKGYELPWSTCLPVFEALQLCWQSIAPCRVHILNITPEIQNWFHALPACIRESCVIHNRIPRDSFFTLLASARVLLIPSLVDGVPNSLYEAMALGTLPIVSPLQTIRSVVENEKNVLFARNLYPQEIASALTLAMTNDVLVDRIVETNLALVRRIADRAVIRTKVLEFYENMMRKI